MPFLREAVERQRQQFIRRLVEAGVYKSCDKGLQKLTLSELVYVFNKHKKN
ncbi:Fur-regulated basic protein FbpA [Rossellomorea aquimaris]|uniref:Fur-regulated basic protein FbpA n=1 Tax=Rossellomorea TaxID=2837508 RepID=UPI001CD1D377|nr:Fur-regulated basic protein FbpA [Rossellomorea aquimaris]MCA1061312.1 Fur-regulated basic protein FbpA [Rossellomorea aquimaris]